VRRATKDDRAALDALLAPLRADYPDFQGWLSRTLSEPTTIVNLGVVDGSSAKGVAIWKPKDARTAKLSTFYLHPDARNLGLGQHLLFHCLRQWVEKRVERAYVTAGADKEDVIRFCLGFGFRVEGAALRRYSGGETELVLTKHLSYRSVTDEALDGWLTEVARSAFSVSPPTPSSAAENWFLPPRSVSRTVSWDAKARRAAFQGDADDDKFGKSVAELEELFYPVRLALKGRAAYVVPIQPQWAERMMDTRPQQPTLPLFTFVDKLRLRIDNAYYCAPVYADDDLVGSPILFYVSAPESALTGVARIIDRVIAEPEDLYLRFGQMGIYKLENIKPHVAKRGTYAKSAMAMHFGWWVPLQQSIPLKKAVETGLLRGHPQRMLKIDYAKFEQGLRQGGIEW
jgi:GNAT superfamily N-acetyltransferase